MNTEDIKLLQGDCLEIMPKLVEQGIKVDAIITDIPYGTTACKWDTIIPFEKMWSELERIVKDNGAIALFGSEPFSSALRMSNIKNYRYDWIWDKCKGFGFANANKMPMKSHEIISVFYKHLPIYNPQKTKGQPYKIKGGIRKQGSKILSGDKEFSSKSRANICSFVRANCYNKGERFPLSIIKYGTDYNRFHPTQKPVALMEYLVKTYTNENDIVLDFTMGSGTTGVACKKLNRKFIGIELDEKYFEIAKQRIENTKVEQELF